MNIAEQILDAFGEDDIAMLRYQCSLRYSMFVKLKDGRHRFQFSDGSYLDIYPFNRRSTMKKI